MPKRTLWVVSLSLVATWAIAFDDYLSAKRKFDQIEAEQFRAGSRVVLTPGELNAWVAHEVPAGVRNPKVWVSSPGIATATALIDFAKVRSGQGHEPGWMMKHLLEGEHPVTVTARIRSENGTATVDVQKVQIAAVEVDGKTLDFLIQNFLLPLYPDAAVGRPFELGHRIEKLDVQPGAVGVWIGK